MWVFDPPEHARCARRETASFFDRYTPDIHFFALARRGMMSSALAIVLDRTGMQTGGK